ncbi:MAG: relaxasome subunit MobC [Clostridiales bacterium]|nr:relaxasome subunit MobC [Clostridiales bacterium]
MATRKTDEEKLLELQRKMEQLKAQEKAIKARQAQAERKARTKRLIEIGAIVESVLGKSIEKEELPKLKTFLEEQENRGHFFSKAFIKKED